MHKCMLQSYTPSRNILYRQGAKKIQGPSAKFEIRRNLNVGLRMTIIVSLFFQEQPIHFVILRPTQVIEASQQKQPLHFVILRPTQVIQAYQ